MKFIPSLLECSEYDLEKKIDILKKNKYHNIHLDFVGKYFARNRKTLYSLSFKNVFDYLKKYFWNTKCDFSIHLMLEKEDILDYLKEIQTVDISSKWQLSLFISDRYFDIFVNSLINYDFEFGIWFDKDQWINVDFDNYIVNNFLLMTVIAGKSGQKLDNKYKKILLEKVKKYKNKNFYADGGWSIDFKINKKNGFDYFNLNIISYTSFWKNFL